jgi:predicted Zn-dependent protease
MRRGLPVLPVVLILAAVLACCGGAFAAEPWPLGPGGGFPDPAAFLEQMFGPQRPEDEQALAKIQVSPREEQQMGQTTVETYLAYLRQQRIGVVDRGKDVEYLQALVETIRPLMTNTKRYPRIKVYLAESSVCEARSLPGGTLVFFRGLLEKAESEAAVVGIVGHELSHLDRGHHLWRLRRMKLAQQTFSSGPQGFSFDRFFTTGSLLLQVFTRPFRPEDEAQADEDGARWAYAAGYDPREMAKLLLTLDKPGGNLPAPLAGFLQSHPAPESRHKAIMEQYEKLRQEEPKQKLYVGKENLRLRVPRAKRQFKE